METRETNKTRTTNKTLKKEPMWRVTLGDVKWKRTWKLWIAPAEILSALAVSSVALEVPEALVV